MKNRLVIQPYLYHHITSLALLQNKVRRLYFYPFANFTWLLGLSHKNRFLPTNIEPQHLIDNHLYDPLKEALACTAMSTKVGDAIHPPSHIYGTSRMSGVEPVSRKSTRKVGREQLHPNDAADMNKYVEGRQVPTQCPHNQRVF